MLGKKNFAPKIMYNLNLEDLVPEDNLYRLLEKFLDLRFLYKECEKLYGKTGKPSIDPVVFFKFQLFGYFENITSDRELIRRATDMLSARYFLGYDIDESLPWHSTISRTRGIMGQDLFEKLFQRVLSLCNDSGLIEGTNQVIDSTLVKANASMESLQRRAPQLSVNEYVKKIYEENSEQTRKDNEDKLDTPEDKPDTKEDKPDTKEEDNPDIKKSSDENCSEDNTDMKNKSNEELKQLRTRKTRKKKKNSRNDSYVSKTDPESRIVSRPGKKTDLYYLTQYTADTKNRIITDVLTTYADIKDADILIESVDRAKQRLQNMGLSIKTATSDRGYFSGRNLRELEERTIKGYMPIKRSKNSAGDLTSEDFSFSDNEDNCICPNNKVLKYYNFDRMKELKRYKARKEDCLECPLKQLCCPEAKFRSVSRSIYNEENKRLKQRLKTNEGKRVSRLRKIISEGLFAEAKTLHGLSKFMTRGLDKAQKRTYMIATVQNLKRLLKIFRRTRNKFLQEMIKKFSSFSSNPVLFIPTYS